MMSMIITLLTVVDGDGLLIEMFSSDPISVQSTTTGACGDLLEPIEDLHEKCFNT